jgi:hypothetical protein
MKKGFEVRGAYRFSIFVTILLFLAVQQSIPYSGRECPAVSLESVLEMSTGEPDCGFRIVPEMTCEDGRLEARVELQDRDGNAIPYCSGITKVWMLLRGQDGIARRYDLDYMADGKIYHALTEPVCGPLMIIVYGEVGGKTLAEILIVECSSCVQGRVIVVPVDYPALQAAINAATPGDTIEVHSGIYRENVKVDKRLTLRGIDTGAGMPVVDAGGWVSAITIYANGVLVEGFITTNSGLGAGVEIGSNRNIIKNNTAINNSFSGAVSIKLK